MRSRNPLVVLVLGCTLALVGACTSSGTTDPQRIEEREAAFRWDAIRQSAGQALDAGVPAVVAVVTDGDRRRVLVRGDAVRKPERRVRVGTPFRIGGLTQPMVATLVMRLVESGRLHLDDTVDDVIPDLLDYGDRVTIEQLLNHSGGMPEVREPLMTGGRVVPDRRVARQLSREGLENSQVPQPAYRASDSLVLGMIVEELTGKSLADLLQDQVFAPAGMPEAALLQQTDPDVVAHGYTTGPGGNDVKSASAAADVTALVFGKAPAAGAVVANAREVDRFAAALVAGDLVEQDTVAQMMAREGASVGGWDDFGLGLALLETGCGTAYGYGGRLPGYAAEMWVLPDLDRRVVVLANSDEPPADRVVEQIRDAALC